MDGPQANLPSESTSIILFVTLTYVFPLEKQLVFK